LSFFARRPDASSDLPLPKPLGALCKSRIKLHLTNQPTLEMVEVMLVEWRLPEEP
jgi:hypothetical protein